MDNSPTNGSNQKRRPLSDVPDATSPYIPVNDRDQTGLAAGMQLFTPTGAQAVEELAAGDHVYALEPTTRLVKQKPLVHVEPVSLPAPIVTISARRIALRLGAGHPVPYWTDPSGRVRFTAADDLANHSAPQFINSWRLSARTSRDTIDITDICARLGLSFEARLTHSGPLDTIRAQLPEGCTPTRYNKWDGAYQFVFDGETFNEYQPLLESLAEACHIHGQPSQWWRPYRFDAVRFCRLLGWYAAEGSVTFDEQNETASISIAQRRTGHRNHIGSLLDEMGLQPSRSPSSIGFSSQLYATLLKLLCGTGSEMKRLPTLVWSLPRHYRRVLLDTLMAGDGSFETHLYYTTSTRLRDDVCRLALSLGIKPRYFEHGGGWAVSLSTIRDRINRRQITHIDTETQGYRCTVADYPTVLAGADGKFQWVGVTNIA